jgi:predicted secreted protein
LRLKGKKAPYLKQDILREAVSEFQIDVSVWEKILSAKNRQIKLSSKEIEELFINFVRELEKIVDIVDRF